MRHDDDTYPHRDDDLWDDELDLIADDRDAVADPVMRSRGTEASPHPHAERPTHASTYTPYDGGYHDDDNDNDDAHSGQPDDGPEDYYSDSDPDPDLEPETPKKPHRRGFFGRKSDAEDEDDDNDYYDSSEEPGPVPVRKPKIPKLDPEDPDYWISDDDSPLSGIIQRPGKKWIWKAAAAFLALVAIVAAWIWYFRPYSDNAVRYGYITHMERRGMLIKTFEGTMIPYKELGDPNPLYFEKLRFSVQSDSLAALMKRMMLGCVPVRVEYETYHAPIPWKGEETMVIVKADTADTRKILPPEYR